MTIVDGICVGREWKFLLGRNIHVHDGEIKSCRSEGKLFGGSKEGKYQRKKCMWKVERRWKKSETNKQAKKREAGKETLSTVSFGVLCYS